MIERTADRRRSFSWEQLVGRVTTGELYVERDVATKCAKRCEEMAEQLRRIRSDAESLRKISGFGDRLPSGVALTAKFERKASGGEYSLDQALADHITVVEQMRDVFLQIEARYAATEEANTAATTAVGASIN
ncbi:hypothetical protein [Prescottella agglutinans]|uniref:Uncharacterized protein n=1 Tax=Prescottella agglutinans TaxID=1644129 RepID=A0ABT6MB62_9NOCA|nr:hypothetical protein [Prescottella agglutinans]MDH6281536.1 hypothetical protein [Prescottella agglutinans]